MSNKQQTAVQWLKAQLAVTHSPEIIEWLWTKAFQMEKEQSERMYSEEDLRNAYRWGTTINHGTKEHFNEWFEQLNRKKRY